ncbi:LacI family DNA-binding transcriptional regulator [Clostridium sp. 19966]|uniref:LacI family DNA-binding transcriptional regulator n=1 Tax=Clostridium sp. 19966 TaxID=2768166 RepID=UPI0028DE67A3|nr:LacI family DNA-binding transcriptional regulator [Clostridium sp. 19966]MDT8717576.1 LacI family DNA-binding transcriptional regulator [Clostridium sp. 19966]
MGVTINDIAEKAEVSLATVSRVINNSGYVSKATRAKVMKVITELNYTPSGIKSFKDEETNTVGVIVPNISDPYFGEIVKCIGEIAERYDYNISIFNTNDEIYKEIKALALLKQSKVKGIIMIPAFGEGSFDNDYFKTLDSIGMPLVLVAASIRYASFNGVFVDNVKGGFDAANLLIQEGHERIAIITGNLGSEPSFDRLIGYKKALTMNNMAINEEYIFEGNYKPESGYNITKEILNMEDKPTALLVGSSMMTIGCIRALNEKGLKTPEDIAIIGFDKVDILNYLGLNVSYVDVSAKSLSQEAIKILFELMQNDDSGEVRTITISPKIEAKGSEKYINKS